MLILSSPSGAGKSSITKGLEREKNTVVSVSVTTRARRSDEIDGVHYRFLDTARFEQMRQRRELLEHALVHGHHYATPRDPVEAALAAGKIVIFDIDVQGTMQLYKTMREYMVSVFILPPSIAEMKLRLTRRAQDSTAAINRRLENAVQEMSCWQHYDYVIVNDDLERATAAVRAIVDAERWRRSRQRHLASFVDSLVRQIETSQPETGPASTDPKP